MQSSVHATETLLFVTLLQLIVMIAAARAGNRLLRALGQPGVVGEIVAGLLLGPSLFGHFFPDASTYVFGAVCTKARKRARVQPLKIARPPP